jgi:hypothetical protein
MYFTVNIGIRPLVCYVTDGVSQYNNWFMAERKLISVTAYDVRLILSEVSREPVVHFRIDDVAFKSPYRYYVSIPNSFDPSVVRRIINVVEKINQVPYHFADVVTVDSSGYSLRVTKVNPGRGIGALVLSLVTSILTRLVKSRHQPLTCR